MAALSLLASCAKREPAQRVDILSMVCSALMSEAAEVQEKALELIAEYADPDDVSLKESFGQYEGAILSSVRLKIPKFLLSSKLPAQLVKQPPAAVTAQVQHSAPHREEIKSELALMPIASLDELILKASYVLENPDQIDDLELVLDGISRLCNERPPDFQKRTSALAKRAQQLSAKIGQDFIQRMLGSLISIWLTGKSPEQPNEHWLARNDFNQFFKLRIEAIAKRIRQGIALPLLSTPTHRFGWLEPGALPERLRAWQGHALDEHDEVLALLRLDKSAYTEVDLSDLNGEFVEALEYALGIRSEPSGSSASLWVAACRTRSPYATDEKIVAHFGDLGPDAGSAAKYEWKIANGPTKLSPLINDALRIKVDPHPGLMMLLNFSSLQKSSPKNSTFKACLTAWSSGLEQLVLYTGSLILSGAQFGLQNV